MTDIVHRLKVLATDHEADDVIPDVAIDAADEIQSLREVVRLLGIYPFTGSRNDPFIAAASQIGAPATERVIAAVKQAIVACAERPTEPEDNGSDSEEAQ